MNYNFHPEIKYHRPISIVFALVFGSLNMVLQGQTYCSATCSLGCSVDFIDGVELNTISNTGTGCSPSTYQYFSNTTTLVKGTQYVLTITSGNNTKDYYYAWIDYNDDGDFTDEYEYIGGFNSTARYQKGTISFNIRENGIVGETVTRMRIRCTSIYTRQPCGIYEYGETEDYGIRIIPFSFSSFQNDTTRFEYFTEYGLWTDYSLDDDIDLVVTTGYFQGYIDFFENRSKAIGLDDPFTLPYKGEHITGGDFNNDNKVDMLQSFDETITATGYSDYTRLYVRNADSYSVQTLAKEYYRIYEIVDIDNDGDQDIFLSGTLDEFGYPSSHFLINDGDLDFSRKETDIVDLSEGDADFGDLDNDGDWDLVITGLDLNKNGVTDVYVNSDGEYSKNISGLPRFKYGSVKVNDLNNDGLADIILMGELGDSIYANIYRNRGGFNFQLTNAHPIGKKGCHIETVDFDGNGYADILYTGYETSQSSRQLFLYRNQGIFSYSPVDVSGVRLPKYPAVADYNYDNKPDLFLAHSSANYTYLFKNQFASASTPPTVPANLSAEPYKDEVTLSWSKSSDVQTAQEGLTYNVFLQKVISDEESITILSPLSDLYSGTRLIAQPGNAGHNTSRIIKNLTPGTYKWQVQAIDNAYCASSFSSLSTFTVDAYFNNQIISTNSWTTSDLYPPNQYIDVKIPVLSADLNSDNNMDAILHTEDNVNDMPYRTTTYSTSVLINNVNNFQLKNLWSGYKTPAFSDFNNDGLLDILTDSAIYLNRDTFYFQKIIHPEFNKQGSCFDYDNDGDPDIQMNNQLYINNDFNFSSKKTLLDGFSFSDIDWGDIDNDGDLDIVFSGEDMYLNPIIAVLSNDNFEFHLSDTILAGFSAEPSLLDYDNDGDLDVFIEHATDNLNFVYNELYKNENGAFVKVDFPIKESGNIAWVDFDNDADMDLFINDILHENMGNDYFRIKDLDIYFRGSELTGTTTFPSAYIWFDINNDSRTDFLVSQYTKSLGYRSISYCFDWFENIWADEKKQPDPPVESDFTIDGFDVILSWNAPDDSQSYSYNIRLGTKQKGIEIISPLSDVQTGKQYLNQLGNAQLNTFRRIRSLKPGTYYWSVQAVDKRYRGGQWSPEESFTLSQVSANFKSDTVCEGLPTKFTDLSVALNGSVDAWKWSFGDGDSSLLKNPTHIYDHGGVYTVSLTAYAGVYEHSKTKTILVKHKPHPGFTANLVCEKSKTSLTNVSDTTNMSVTNWRWNFGDGDISFVRGSVEHPYLTPSDFQTKLVIAATNGCSDSLVKTVTVGRIPNATVGLDFGYPVFCKGKDSCQLSVEQNETYNYQWKFNNFNITGATMHRLVIKNSGDYSVAVVNPVGTCTAESEKKTIMAVPTPDQPAITASLVPAVICPGDSVRLEATYYPNYIYQWRMNMGTIGTDTNFFYARSEGNYTLEVTAVEGCKSDTSASVFVDISRPDKPAIGVSGDIGFCEGDSVVLSVPSNADYTYRWRNDNGYIPGMTGTEYTARESGNYYLEITNQNHCSGVSDPIEVTVSSRPDTPSVYVAGPVNFCPGDSVLLYTEYNPDYTYQWEYNGGIAGSGSTRIYAKSEGTYRLAIQVVNVGQCSKTESRIIEITLLHNPNKPTVTLDRQTEICTGQTVQLTVPSITGYAYQWKRDENNLSGAASNTYAAASSGAYSVRITNPDGCSVISDPVTITVSDPPRKSNIEALSDTVICQGKTVSLSVPYNLAYSYQWNLNGRQIPGATGEAFDAMAAGLYTVVVGHNRCYDTTQAKEVTYKPGLPKPMLHAYGPNAWYLICSIENVKYKWYYNETLVTENDKSIFYAGSNMGEYYVEVNKGYDCWVPSDKVVIPLVPTGINLADSKNEFYVYPNPADDHIRIFCSGPFIGRTLIRIYDAEGRIVMEQEVNKDQFYFSMDMKLSGLTSGIYMIELYSDEVILKTRFMIM